MNQDVAIAVLAGGQSRRMGRDKAEIELDGATLLERIAYVANVVAPTVVIGRERPEEFEFERIPFLKDEQPGLGPIGGLQTALQHFGTPVLLLGCDMPLMKPDSLQWLLDSFVETTAEDGLATLRDGQIEPLFSVYGPSCLRLIDEMLEEKRRALRALIERGSFDRLEAPPKVAATLLNVNTPGELTDLKRRL